MKGRTLDTVYFGGGTPTSLKAEELDALLTKIENTFDLSKVQEFTVEAGRPDSITEDKFKVLRAHNISRISINPQTMKQATLDLIGRHHTVDMVKEKFRMARDLGFDNINMDLIIGLPEEDIDDVRSTMEQVRELAPDSVTVHSLAIKRAARLNIFKERYANLKIQNTQEMIDLTAKYAREMGLEPYYLYRQKNMAGNLCGTRKSMYLQYPHHGGKADHRGLRCRNHHESHVPGGKPSGTRGECEGCSFLYREDRRDDR